MIDAEEIAKLPPLKRIKPLALSMAYDLIPYAAGLALAVLMAAAAHAAIHPDCPVQDIAPVASKIEPACVQSTTIMRWIRDEKGKWRILGTPVVGFEQCHI